MNLPPWASELRPHQETAIADVLSDFQSGNKVVFCEAPTGSGKTLIAEMVRQELSCKGIYLCSSISLQSQYMRDFPASTLLMGRSNYPTKDYPHLYNQTFNGVTSADCTKRRLEEVLECKWCDPVSQCPYEIAKRKAILSNQVCSNTYYYLYEANHVGTLRNRELVIIDECDGLENILMSYVEVSFSQRQVTDLKLPTPSKKTVEEAWLDWGNESKEILRDQTLGLAEPSYSSSIQYVKQYNRVNRAYSDILRLTDPAFGLPAGGWIYTGYGEGNIQFRPVKVSQMAEQCLWRHGLRFLLMSATIISTQEMADSLGLE